MFTEGYRSTETFIMVADVSGLSKLHRGRRYAA